MNGNSVNSINGLKQNQEEKHIISQVNFMGISGINCSQNETENLNIW